MVNQVVDGTRDDLAEGRQELFNPSRSLAGTMISIASL